MLHIFMILATIFCLLSSVICNQFNKIEFVAINIFMFVLCGVFTLIAW